MTINVPREVEELIKKRITQLKLVDTGDLLKSIKVTYINEEIVDGIKKKTTYLIYSISVGGEITFRDGFEMVINPSSSVFVQVYNKVKEIYPTAIDL